MSDAWRWIGADGFEYSGSLERLRESLDEGKLGPDTEVWRAGLESWQPAHSVAELSDVARARHFTPLPEMKTPPPIGISADAVVVRPPQGQMTALTPPPAPAARVEARARSKRRHWMVRALPVAIGGVVVLGAIGAIAAYVRERGKPATSAPSASASAAPSASPEPAAARVLRCTADRTKPLSKPVLAKVPIAISATPGSAALRIGLAEERSVAKIILVDGETLAVREAKSVRADGAIVAVLPQGGEASVVDVDDSRLRLARTIEAEPPFKLGIGPDGVARLDPAGQLVTIWPGDARAEHTVPRGDGSSERGFFVTLRRGGLAGRVLAGWLAPDGAKRSALETVGLSAVQVGTPTAAVGKSAGLLAVAARASADGPWDIALGTAAAGDVPARLNPLATPRSTEGAPRMSPAVAALGDGRWALQWTERTRAGHVVRLQLLNAELGAASEPVTVSPEGSESGQGEIWARGDRLVSVFLVRSAAGHELWASVVACR